MSLLSGGRRGRAAAGPWLDGTWLRLIGEASEQKEPQGEIPRRSDRFESGEHVHCNIEPLFSHVNLMPTDQAAGPLGNRS